MGIVEATRAKDVRLVCGSDASSIEKRVRNAIKEGLDLGEMVANNPGVCILMIDRRLSPGEEII